ncbi:nucleoside hydrolase [Caulobacter phage Seuss]|uniref:Nucleoside hydrolase n=1 Tax=Caulobacter phage Seuss TaxID=1675601 RepID=A0A0K1LM56_9CAUD|nr:nucleoside hydrolase [Caulobacter phage Seuss]AKU43586.1 nucleoside hydrolase [Caulobacter phage Seuss]
MLNRLKYSVHFPTPLPHGRKLSADVTIGSGFWAITGPNEAGKSMIFEIARWLLFGTSALRGKSDHYKTLHGVGEFTIRGNSIEIERTTSKATMKRNGVTVATGTKPVNQKVLEELGFGMAVFDIANSINQGEVEALGKMKPTERKAMVDSVLGLNMLDDVVKWAVGEAGVIDKQVEALLDRLVPPTAEPRPYATYIPSSDLQPKLAEARGVLAELNELNGWLAVDRPRPTKPETNITLSAAELEGLANTRKELRQQVSALEVAIHPLQTSIIYSAELLDQVEQAWTAYRAWEEAQAWLRQNPQPTYTVPQLQEMQEAWRLIAIHEMNDRLQAVIQGLEAQRDTLEHVNCPACTHDFVPDQEAVKRLDDAIEKATSELQLVTERPATPAVPAFAIDNMIKVIETYDWTEYELKQAVPEAVKPSLSGQEIDQARQVIINVERRAQLEAELKPLKVRLDGMADFEAMRAERVAYETSLAQFQIAEKDWEAWQAERLKKLSRQKAIVGAADVVASLEVELEAAQAYERTVAEYERTLKAYNEGRAAIVALETEAKELRKVREVMAVLRGLIKQHVLPSLNLVASQLLRKMTGGQRSLIQVDENFDVLVDTQDLETLSGSGKACANLALRIALGQVLTHRIFPLMLADEIDASMDADRAEMTGAVLQALQERVQQVLLVTHKPVDTNVQSIRLGASE